MSEADKLATIFKRKGHFDKYRKQFYDSFYKKVSASIEGDEQENSNKLDTVIKDKMKKKLLDQRSNGGSNISSSKNLQYITQSNKGKVSGLIIGSLYKDSELDALIDSYIQELFASEYQGVEMEIKSLIQEIKTDDASKGEEIKKTD